MKVSSSLNYTHTHTKRHTHQSLYPGFAHTSTHGVMIRENSEPLVHSTCTCTVRDHTIEAFLLFDEKRVVVERPQ